jgi:hypothetical protein
VSSLSDVITVAKNINSAITSLASTYLSVQGLQSFPALPPATTTLVKSSAGRLCVVSVTTAGSAVGTIYDSASTATLTRPIYIIPNTVGVYVVNIPTSYGIAVATGAGQVVTVSYS